MTEKLDRMALVVDGRCIGRAGLHQRIAERLRRQILRCELPPGAALSEAKLCLALGVSRTPLREALKLLSAEGLVELRPNRSPLVRSMREEEVLQLFEAVAGLERIAAELAAIRLSPAALARLGVLQRRIEAHHDAGQKEPYFRINEQIHRAIVAGAANVVLVETHAALLVRAERARFAALATRGRWEESIAEHRAVLEALRQRDVTAGRVLAQHVLRTGEVVAQALRDAARRAA